MLDPFQGRTERVAVTSIPLFVWWRMMIGLFGMRVRIVMIGERLSSTKRQSRRPKNQYYPAQSPKLCSVQQMFHVRHTNRCGCVTLVGRPRFVKPPSVDADDIGIYQKTLPIRILT